MSTQERQADNNKMLEKVRKLLAKAEGTDNEQEAETFIAAAAGLMEKYAIDQALLDATRPAEKRQVPTTITFTMIDYYTHRDFFEVQCMLLNSCASRNRCQAWVTPGRSQAHVAGFETDARYVELLFTSIYLQMESRFATDIVITPKINSKSKRTGKVSFKALNKDTLEEIAKGPNYRIEFMRGYIYRVDERLKEMSGNSGPGTELVLAGIEERVNQYMDSLNLQLGSLHTRPQTRDEAARRSGRSAADKANLRPGAGLRQRDQLGS